MVKKSNRIRNAVLIVVILLALGFLTLLASGEQAFTFAPSQSQISCSGSSEGLYCKYSASNAQAGLYYADASRTRVKFTDMGISSSADADKWISEHKCYAYTTGTDKWIEYADGSRLTYDKITSAKIINNFPTIALQFYSPHQGSTTLNIACHKPKPICNPGETKCYENSAVVKCSDNGFRWEAKETCVKGCLNGLCVAPPQACNPNEKKCEGDNIHICSGTGDIWIPDTECEFGCIGTTCKQAPELTPETNETEEETNETIIEEITEEISDIVSPDEQAQISEEVTQEEVEQVTQELQEEKSIFQRFWEWFKGVLGLR